MQKKKPAICIVLAVLLLSPTFLIYPANAEETGYQNVTVQQAKHMIKHTPDIVILDVRNQSEYSLGHLYAAVSLPLYVLDMFYTGPTRTINGSTGFSLPPDRRILDLQDHINDTVLVYCQGGSRSAQAAQILADNGFTNVYNMIGGITEWMETGYPIYTSYHHVDVNVTENGTKSSIDIEPLLLYQANCTSCQSQGHSCSSSGIPANVTQTILERTN